MQDFFNIYCNNKLSQRIKKDIELNLRDKHVSQFSGCCCVWVWRKPGIKEVWVTDRVHQLVITFCPFFVSIFCVILGKRQERARAFFSFFSWEIVNNSSSSLLNPENRPKGLEGGALFGVFWCFLVIFGPLAC